jgi:hypothetical protein
VHSSKVAVLRSFARFAASSALRCSIGSIPSRTCLRASAAFSRAWIRVTSRSPHGPSPMSLVLPLRVNRKIHDLLMLLPSFDRATRSFNPPALSMMDDLPSGGFAFLIFKSVSFPWPFIPPQTLPHIWPHGSPAHSYTRHHVGPLRGISS